MLQADVTYDCPTEFALTYATVCLDDEQAKMTHIQSVGQKLQGVLCIWINMNSH